MLGSVGRQQQQHTEHQKHRRTTSTHFDGWNATIQEEEAYIKVIYRSIRTFIET